MLEKNGAQVLCDYLRHQHVEVVFGIPGVHNLCFFEALRRAKIRMVIATHEQSLGLMAHGYYRATGKTGVFVTVPGPGLTNAFTSIAESLLDSCAVVGIVASVKSDTDKKFQLHEIQQIELAKPIVKGVFRVTAANQVYQNADAAFRLAQSGEPGPVILDVAANVFWDKLASNHFENTAWIEEPSVSVRVDVDQVIDRICRARQVGLVVGQGAFNAAAQVEQVAEWLGAPVATTVSGRGCLREDHPLSLGFRWGKRGLDRMHQVLDHCDLILAVGVKFSETGTAGYALRFNGELIHVDSSAEVLGQNYATAIALQMDARDFFDQLLANKARLGHRPTNRIRQIIAEQKMSGLARARANPKEIQFIVGGQTYSPHAFFHALRHILPHDAIVVTDSGYNQFLTLENFPVYMPRTMITPSDYQAMGYAIPSALGAAIACPNKKVVAIVGDGGFVMSGLELLSAQREKIAPLILVLNDGYYGFMKQIQEEVFGATTGVALANPDFKKLAESLNVHYCTCENGDDLHCILEDCLQHSEPVLLEVRVVYPHNIIATVKRRWRANLKQWAVEGFYGFRHVHQTWQSFWTRSG